VGRKGRGRVLTNHKGKKGKGSNPSPTTILSEKLGLLKTPGEKKRSHLQKTRTPVAIENVHQKKKTRKERGKRFQAKQRA